MAEVKRIANKSSITNGNASTNLSLNDKLLSQHTSGDNSDKSISILQAQLTPYGTCATASATATKTVTMVNFPDDFTALVGTKIRVKFTYANTATSQMYLKVGALSAKPATCRGVAMASGSIRAGAEIEFMYDGTNWDCQFSEPISAMDTTSASPINSSALNGALANYQSIEVLGGGTYTISELVTLLLGKTETQKTKKFIIKNEYNNGIVISNFLGGTTSYRFIVGDITCSKYSNNQYSLIFNINTYYIDSNRYFANLLVEYSCTNTGQEKWTKYTTDTDLNGALANYSKIKVNKVTTFIDNTFNTSEISYTEDNGIVHVWGTITNTTQKVAYCNICNIPRPQSNKVISSFLYNTSGDTQKLQIITDTSNKGRLQNQVVIPANSIIKFDYTYAGYYDTVSTQSED